MWHDVKGGFYSEKMLWLAVLRRAIYDYVLYRGIGFKVLDWKRAYQFIFMDGVRHDEGLSWEEICGLWGWDHQYLRRLTKSLTKEDIRKLESSVFKGDFFFDLAHLVYELTVRWDSQSAAPFMQNRQIAKPCQDYTVPRVVYREILQTSPPLVKWAA
jgi:hypothetical protein